MGEYSRHHNYTVDLNKPLKRHFCGVLLASGDNDGDDFIFTIQRDGETYKPTILPIMYGYFMRSDGKTVVLDGTSLSKDSGVASFTLDEKCYACEGRFTLTAKLMSYPDVVTTVAIIDGYIRKTATNSTIYPDNEEASGGVSWATVPGYWQTHIDAQVNAVNTAMAAAAGGRSAFLFYTDAHWTYSYQQSPALLKYLCMNTPMKKVYFGGDIIGDEAELSYLNEWREDVSQLPCHHSVAGNHDDSINDTWTLNTVYDFLLAPEVTDDVVRGANLYYHIDVAGEKTRYIFLDTATKTGNILNDSAQAAWLKKTLRSTPDGWHIVAIGHIWRTYTNTGSVYADAGWSQGGKMALDMFDAYNARTGDYSACTGKVEFCIGGHLHWDADSVSDGGIPVIIATCDSYGVRNGATASSGSVTSAAVNAIVADYAAGVVKVIRVGRGNSRTVQLDGSGSVETTDYDLIAPTGNFTNMLDTATDADGVTVYNNGNGYKNDVRYSTSSNAETAATGWDLTGYIPAKVGDVLRFHGVEFMDMNNTGGTTKRNAIMFFGSSRGYIDGTANWTTSSLPSSAWSPEYGDDGDVVKLTIPTSYGANVAYIRICAKNLTGASIITVNEEINITG